MLQIHSFTFNPLQENTYILFDETKECVIIDPGCYEKDEEEALANFIKQQDLKPVYLLNTHCHLDHVLGNKFCKNTYQLKLHIHPNEIEILRAAPLFAALYGVPLYQETEPEAWLNEREQISFGNTTLDVLFVPGHSPGHVAFICHESKAIISGDVLFKQSIGRTDLPGGNHSTLIKSIQSQLFLLPEDYDVFPGHGPKTTIGFEKKHNPYLQ
jgi:hydroxyacylglutathione hydrolase